MNGESTPAPPKPKNNAWIWFFAFLLVASVGVVAFMIWFNNSIQLTPEKLAENLQRWKEKGPRDYKLTYTKRINNDPRDRKSVV